MQPISFGVGPLQKATILRPGTKEKKMRAYSMSELFGLTRCELLALHQRITSELMLLPDGSDEHVVILRNLPTERMI